MSPSPQARPPRAELVERDDLERELERVASRVRDPRLGLYGPDSMMWEVGKHSALFLGGGRAALLQLAHPYVAHGVDQHSKTRSDPFGRFQRTFRNVFAMVYGDLETAMRAARRVHTLHRTIQGAIREDVGAYHEGDLYRANEEHALLWVHATLWETSIQVYELVVRPLSEAEKNRYYDETRLFAALFGIRPETLPADWRAFMDYNRRMWASDEVTVGAPAREIASFLFKPPYPGVGPVSGFAKVLTAGLLPARIRKGFGLPFGLREGVLFDASLETLRRSHGLLPRRVRYLPPYVSARRRIAGRRGRDRVGEMLNRIYTGSPRAA